MWMVWVSSFLFFLLQYINYTNGTMLILFIVTILSDIFKKSEEPSFNLLFSSNNVIIVETWWRFKSVVTHLPRKFPIDQTTNISRPIKMTVYIGSMLATTNCHVLVLIGPFLLNIFLVPSQLQFHVPPCYATLSLSLYLYSWYEFSPLSVRKWARDLDFSLILARKPEVIFRFIY